MSALKSAKDACFPRAFPPGGGVRRGLPVGRRAGRRPLAWAGLAAAAWLLAAPAFAQTYTWTAGTGTWDGISASTWAPAGGPPINGNTVLLTQTSAAGSPIAIDYTATNLTGTGLTALTLGNAGGGITTLTLNDGDFLPTQKFTMNVGGAMTMTGGTFGASTNLGGQGAWVLNSGTVNISGGLFQAPVGANSQLQIGNSTQTGNVAVNLSNGTLQLVRASGNFDLAIGGNSTFSSSLIQTGGTAGGLTTGTGIFAMSVGDKGTYSLDGGLLSTQRGITVNSGGTFEVKSGTANQSLGVFTVNSGGLVKVSGGQLANTTGFSVAGGGTVQWTGGSITSATDTAGMRSVVLSGSGALFSMTNRIMTLNQSSGATGTSSLQLAAGSVLRAIGSGTIQDDRFAQSSWGGVSMNGRVVADGNGSDSALNMTRFGRNGSGTVAWLFNQTDNTTNNGWFATNKGSLQLPTLTIASTGTINWGEDNADTTIDLVNSMRLTSAGVTSGSFAITLLANDRTDMATPLSTLGVSSANVFSLFKLDPQGGFAFGSGNLSLQIRYDDANVAAGTAGALRLMRYNNSGWTDISSSVDSTNKTISSQSITSFGTLYNGGVLLSVNSAPSAVYSLSATASGTAIRVGDTSTLTAVISNGTATVTPDSLGYTGLSLSSAGALSSSSGTVAPGLSSSGSVAYTGTAGGSFTFSPTVTSATNVNLGTAATLSGSTGVTVSVYNPASANSVTPVSLGNVYANGVFGTGTVPIWNTGNAAANFQEGLTASGTATSGGATTSGTTTNLFATSGTSTQITVGLGGASTAAVGVKTGTVTLGFTSTGTTSAGATGLAPLSLNSQNVTVTGTVWNPAAVNSITTPVTIGSVRVNGTFGTSALTITNTAASGSFTEVLGATATTNGAASSSGSVSALAGGSTSTSLVVGLGGSGNTGSAGLKSGTATISFTSTGGPGTASIAAQGVAVSGNVYNPAAANTLSSPVSLGNVRVGGTASQTLTILNTATATTGFQEGLAASVSGTTGQATGSGSILNLITGSSTAISVGLNTATAGALSGTVTLGFTSTGTTSTGATGLTPLPLDSQNVTVTGTVWNAAAANTISGSFNLGTFLVSSTATQVLSITNTAPDDGFSEKLNASFGPLSGVTTNSGSFNLLAAGSTSTALSIYLTSGSAAANATGSAQVNFQTDGFGTSGLAAENLSPQTVTLAATFLDRAVASFSGTATQTFLTLDFGTVSQNASPANQSFDFWNLMQTNGLTADLALLSGTGTGDTGAFSMNVPGSFNNLAAGTFNPYTVSFNTATGGDFQSVYTFQFKSANAGTVFTNDTQQTLTLTLQGSVIVVPEPASVVIALAGVGGAAFLRRRRRKR